MIPTSSLIKPVRSLILSDIHLGHRRNSTVDIIKNLEIFFDHYKPRSDLDILFLAGDVFDTLLDLASEDSIEIHFWIKRLCVYCAENRIKLRVLEGTRSHDWNQSELFNTIQALDQIPVDLKYISKLSIEYMEDLGLHVLYIPDEWHPNPNETLKQVKALMGELGLMMVDIAIMHGQFKYQLPKAASSAPCHDEVAYLSLVRYFISIGHIHTHSVYEHILSQGSFDRLSHNEEEPKGGIETLIRPDETMEFWFRENKMAKTFMTLNLRQMDIDQSIAFIERKVKKLRPGSYVRIKAKHSHPAIIGFDEVKKLFPYFILSKKVVDEETSVTPLAEVAEEDYKPLILTPTNLAPVLLEAVQANNSLPPIQFDRCQSILNEVIHG